MNLIVCNASTCTLSHWLFQDCEIICALMVHLALEWVYAKRQSGTRLDIQYLSDSVGISKAGLSSN
jgi:hypothetical protein